MKNRITKIMLIGFSIFLTGCVKVRMTLDINGDGQVNSVSTLLLDNELLTFNGVPLDDALEDLKASMAEDNPGAEITIIKEEGAEGESSYSGVSLTVENDQDLDVTVENNTVTLRMEANEVRDDMAESAENFGISGDVSLKDLGFEATLIVNMPADATSNVGTVSGKTVTVDLLDIPAGVDEIVISSKTGKLNMAGIAVGIAAALAACAAVFFFIRSRKKNTQDPAFPESGQL